MNNDLISRSELLMEYPVTNNPVHIAVKNAPAVEAEPAQITGDTSDGYHTFNELYHHRAVLFSVIVKAFPEKAWKARKHHDGTMYDGMFIVGIDTPEGQATYHYDIDPYWDMFNCAEREFAPEWDGHTAAQAIERIGKLEPVQHAKAIFKVRRKWDGSTEGTSETVPYCSGCDKRIDDLSAPRCSWCGAMMDAEAQT